MNFSIDPIIQDDDGLWWYITEDYSSKRGGYETEEEAREALEEYCRYIGGCGYN